MTEVEYGGGGHRTRLRNDHEDQLVCLEVPLPPYIKEQGGGRPALGARQERRSPPPSWSRTPLFLVLLGGGKEGGEGEGKGASPPFPSPIRTSGGGGARPALAAPLSLSTKAHLGPLVPRGCSGNPPALRFYLKPSGTLPLSK